MSKDYYAILGVNKGANDDEIKKSFRRLAHEHHPDKGGDPAKFKDINEAYQVLADPQKRKMYDQFGSAAFEQGAGAGPGGFGGFGGFDFSQGFQGQDLGDLGDMLGEMFGFGGMGGGTRRAPRGKDIQMDLELTFRDAAFGVEKTLSLYKPARCSKCQGKGNEPGTKLVKCDACKGTGQVRRTQRTMFGTIQSTAACETCHGRGERPEKPCATCHGSGVERREVKLTIKIPSGVSTGEALKVEAQGEEVGASGRPGDLYLRLHVQDDPRFERDDHDVLTTAHVPITVLALGGDWKVETLDGEESVKIPEATRPGTVIKLRGKGIAYARGGRGDQLVTLAADMPKRVSREQKKILEQLRDAGM